MTDLWTEATYDAEAERHHSLLVQARRALAPSLSFVAGAATRAEAEDRLALVAEKVERVVDALTEGDPAMFPIIHSALLDSWTADLDKIERQRADESQRIAQPRKWARKHKVAAGGAGAFGWPLVPSPNFPGETTLACPECGSTNIWFTGSNLGSDVVRGTEWSGIECRDCGTRSGHPIRTRRDGTGTDVTGEQWGWKPTESAARKRARQARKTATDWSGGWASTAPHGQGPSEWGTRILPDGTEVRLYRGPRNVVRFYDAQGNQHGVEQPNVAPAFAYADSEGWHDPGSVRNHLNPIGGSRKTATRLLETSVWYDSNGIWHVRVTIEGVGDDVLARREASLALWEAIYSSPGAGPMPEKVGVQLDCRVSNLGVIEYYFTEMPGSAMGRPNPHGNDDYLRYLHTAESSRKTASLVASLVDMKDGDHSIFSGYGIFCHVWFDGDSITDDYGNTAAGSGIWQVVVTDSEELVGGREFARKEFRLQEARNRSTVANMVADYIQDRLFRAKTGSRQGAGSRKTGADWRTEQASVNTYPGLEESVIFDVVEYEGGEATVVHAFGQYHWSAVGRDGQEAEGIAESKGLAQQQALDFLNGHNQIAGQMSLIGTRKRATNPFAKKDDDDDEDEGDEGDPKPVDNDVEEDGDEGRPDDQGDVEGDAEEAPEEGAEAPGDTEVEDEGEDPSGDDEASDEAVADAQGDVMSGEVEESSATESISPDTMAPGQTATMGFTTESGQSGEVEVTFVREENSVFWFDGPTGSFGIAKKGDEWIDAAGSTFSFTPAGSGDEQPEKPEQDDEAEAPVTDGQNPASDLPWSTASYTYPNTIATGTRGMDVSYYIDQAGNIRSVR